MSDITKTKVIDIQTGKSEKNVMTLRGQIRELKEQLALLENGTEEYNRVGTQLANLQQKQIEIQEIAKYSNKDLGATLSNLTTVSTGVIGAFNAMNATLSLFGVEGADAEEAMKKIQLTMAVIQGISAVDAASKALVGLRNAFKGIGAEQQQVAASTTVATQATGVETQALVENSQTMLDNNEIAKELDIANRSNTETTLKSVEAIALESEARGQSVDAIRQQIAELKETQQEMMSTSQNRGFSPALDEYKRQINELLEKIDFFNSGNSISISAEDNQKNIDELKKLLNEYERLRQTGVTAYDDLKFAAKGIVTQLNEAAISSLDEIEELADRFNDVIGGMSFEDATASAKAFDEEIESIIEGWKNNIDYLDDDSAIENLEVQIQDLQDVRRQANSTFEETIQKAESLRQQEQKLSQTQKATTTTTRQQSKALQEATARVKAQQAQLAAGGNMWTKFGVKAKMALTGIKSAIIATGIGAAIMLLMEGMTWLIDKFKEWRAEANEVRNFNAKVNESMAEQRAEMLTLIDTYKNGIQSQEERKAVINEILKLYPDAIKYMNDEKTIITDLNGLLEDYNNKLITKIKYELLEEKLKENLKEQAKVQEKINKLQDAFFFRLIRTENQQGKLNNLHIKELEILKQIQDLDLSKVFGDDKTTGSGSSGIVRTLKQVVDELKKVWGDLVNTIFDEKQLKLVYNGVYDEIQVAINNILRLIKANNLETQLSEQFKGIVNGNFQMDLRFDVTADLIFGKDKLKELEDRLVDEQNKLSKMISAGKIYTKEQVQAEQDVVNSLKNQVTLYNTLAEAVTSLYKVKNDYVEKLDEQTQKQKDYNHQIEVEKTLRDETRNANAYANVNKEIETNKYLIEQSKEKCEAYDNELLALKSKDIQNKETLDRIAELERLSFEEHKKLQKAETDYDKAQYDKRTIDLELFYNRKAQLEKETDAIANAKDYVRQGGVQDYNQPMDDLQLQLQRSYENLASLQEYYKKQVEDGLMSQLDADIEFEGRKTSLEQEQADLRVQITEEEGNKKIAALNAWVGAYQMVSNSISSILQQEMSTMDENSEEYKKLQIANGVTTTLSGSLGAFMSGFQSGIPFPYNVILAAVLASATFAAGMMQLRNIENGTKSNAMKADIGSTYETVAYENQADLLTDIKDTTQFVSVTDINDTQNKVKVRDRNSKF